MLQLYIFPDSEIISHFVELSIRSDGGAVYILMWDFYYRYLGVGGCSKVLCGIFSFRAVRRKAAAVKFYVGFLIKILWYIRNIQLFVHRPTGVSEHGSDRTRC